MREGESKKREEGSILPEFSPSLDQNIKIMERLFEGDNTLNFRKVQCQENAALRCAVYFFDGMSNSELIGKCVVAPILRYKKGKIITAEILAQEIIQVGNSAVEEDVKKIFEALLAGDCIVFLDGDRRPVVSDVKSSASRSPAEPDNEQVLQGPREGFTEHLITNLSLVRRRLATNRLKFTFLRLGEQTNTLVSLCYIDGICDEKVLAELKRRLQDFSMDGVLDSNYILECCQDSKRSPFPTMGVTERPDILAAKLLEGRAALIINGTPVAITVPHLFLECFQTNDDYYLNYYYTGVTRLLRYFGLFTTLFAPALFLALINFHPELIPTRLLLSIAAAGEGVPFPPLFEALVLLIIFEVLKETGTRTPSGIGQTLSIVGGLILGQAAVEARFVSAPMVIVIAFAGTTALMVPKLKSSALVFRFLFLIAAAVMGLYGVLFAATALLFHLASLRSFGIPYLANYISARANSMKDVFLRYPWFSMRKYGRFLAEREPDEEVG